MQILLPMVPGLGGMEAQRYSHGSIRAMNWFLVQQAAFADHELQGSVTSIEAEDLAGSQM